MSINLITAQTMSVWAEPGATCEAVGQRPCPVIVGQTLKDSRAVAAVILCQQLGAPPAAITQATGVGEDTQRLIAERRTADSQRVEKIITRLNRK